MITAEIKKISQGISQGEIIVWANYKIDGLDVPSAYVCANGEIRARMGELLGTYAPEENLDGAQLYCTRYDALQFANMSDQEIKDFIVGQSQAQVDNLVKKEYSKVENLSIADRVKSVVGQTVQADSVTVQISPTEEVTVSQDGTKGAVSMRAVPGVIS